MSTSKLAERIRKARLDVPLSQRELSKSLSVSEKAVSSYEAGRTEPNIPTLKRIAKATNKPIAYFTDEPEVEFELYSKIIKIEKELLEIKQLLKKRPNLINRPKMRSIQRTK